MEVYWERPGNFGLPLGSNLDFLGVPVVAQWLMNLTRNQEVVGTIPGFA